MAAPLPTSRLLPSGDSAIAVEFARAIDDIANQRVLALDKAMAAAPVEDAAAPDANSRANSTSKTNGASCTSVITACTAEAI